MLLFRFAILVGKNIYGFAAVEGMGLIQVIGALQLNYISFPCTNVAPSKTDGIPRGSFLNPL